MRDLKWGCVHSGFLFVTTCFLLLVSCCPCCILFKPPHGLQILSSDCECSYSETPLSDSTLHFDSRTCRCTLIPFFSVRIAKPLPAFWHWLIVFFCALGCTLNYVEAPENCYKSPLVTEKIHSAASPRISCSSCASLNPSSSC